MGNGKCKILMVEDDEIDQMAYKRMVDTEKLPYESTIAGSVAEARSILIAQQFDVLITDYNLPDGTGLDVLNLIKDTPVIFVTGAGNQEIAVKAMKGGACDYLMKDPQRNYLKVLPQTVQNVVKQKALKDMIERKQKNLEAIFDAAPVGMLLLDENMVVKRVNNAISELSGNAYSTMVEHKICDALSCINSTDNQKLRQDSHICEVCPLVKTIKVVLDSEKPAHKVEFQHTFEISGSETKLWLCMSVEPVVIDDRKHTVTAIEDITERKNAEQQLKETTEIKSQFISTVSHELRTPLTCMKEAVGVIWDGAAGEVMDKQRHFLDIVKRNIDRLAVLVNDVLDFQKLESGRMNPNMELNDIGQVTKSVHDTMLLFAKKKGLDLSLELADNLPKAVFDSDKIVQVLTNLISNAIKFTPEGGRVSVCVEYQCEELVIRIGDTGMGIPKEHLPKIFEQFYRVPRPGLAIPGTGLGLPIVNKIVALHGGRIEVESEVDRGSLFTVFLPLNLKSVPEVPQMETKQDSLLEGSLSSVTSTNKAN